MHVVTKNKMIHSLFAVISILLILVGYLISMKYAFKSSPRSIKMIISALLAFGLVFAVIAVGVVFVK